jgi:uncharacterized membrane protein YjfL (UPF0719 family)
MDEKLIGKKRKRILVGGILIVLGFVLVVCALLIEAPGGYMWNFSPFYLVTASFLIISVGLWYLMTSINPIVSYFLMGMICVLSPLMYVYTSLLLRHSNYLEIHSLNLSLFFGMSGMLVGAVGILQNAQDSSKARLALMIMSWFFAMVLSLFVPMMCIS